MSPHQTREAAAIEAWGPECPAWVLALARACDKTSQGAVARELGRSTSLVSTIIRGKYNGDLAAQERRVRAVLMAEVITCPQLGRIPLRDCQDWQERAGDFQASNALRVQMYRACQRCAVFQNQETDDD